MIIVVIAHFNKSGFMFLFLLFVCFFRDSVSYFFFMLILLIDLIFASPAKRDELPTVLEWLVLIWVSVQGFPIMELLHCKATCL